MDGQTDLLLSGSNASSEHVESHSVAFGGHCVPFRNVVGGTVRSSRSTARSIILAQDGFQIAGAIRFPVTQIDAVAYTVAFKATRYYSCRHRKSEGSTPPICEADEME